MNTKAESKTQSQSKSLKEVTFWATFFTEVHTQNLEKAAEKLLHVSLLLPSPEELGFI